MKSEGGMVERRGEDERRQEGGWVEAKRIGERRVSWQAERGR